MKLWQMDPEKVGLPSMKDFLVKYSCTLEFLNKEFTYISKRYECGCIGELTDVPSDKCCWDIMDLNLYLQLIPCTWHARHWNYEWKNKFPIENWGIEMSRKYGLKINLLYDEDLDVKDSELQLTPVTPRRMLKQLNRELGEAIWSHFEEDE